MTDDEAKALAIVEAERRAKEARLRQWVADEPKRAEADYKRMIELQAERERRPANPAE